MSEDPSLGHRVQKVVEFPVHRLEPREDVAATVPSGALILFHAPRLDRLEQTRLERLLAAVSNPVVVLCPTGDPLVVFSLARSFPVDRLIAVESDLGRERLTEVLPRWHMVADLRPDWSALGVPDRPAPLLARLQRLVDADPARNWSVEELADALRVSRSTLTRIVRDGTGRSPKSLLLELRYQLVERARTERRLETGKIAELFEFPSTEEVHRWRYRHRAMRSQEPPRPPGRDTSSSPNGQTS